MIRVRARAKAGRDAKAAYCANYLIERPSGLTDVSNPVYLLEKRFPHDHTLGEPAKQGWQHQVPIYITDVPHDLAIWHDQLEYADAHGTSSHAILHRRHERSLESLFPLLLFSAPAGKVVKRPLLGCGIRLRYERSEPRNRGAIS